jgi:hypothetical protein
MVKTSSDSPPAQGGLGESEVRGFDGSRVRRFEAIEGEWITRSRISGYPEMALRPGRCRRRSDSRPSRLDTSGNATSLGRGSACSDSGETRPAPERLSRRMRNTCVRRGRRSTNTRRVLGCRRHRRTCGTASRPVVTAVGTRRSRKSASARRRPVENIRLRATPSGYGQTGTSVRSSHPGTLEPWNPGTLEPWNPGTLEPRTLEPSNPRTLEPW